jgi:hypothetical protein
MGERSDELRPHRRVTALKAVSTCWSGNECLAGQTVATPGDTDSTHTLLPGGTAS